MWSRYQTCCCIALWLVTSCCSSAFVHTSRFLPKQQQQKTAVLLQSSSSSSQQDNDWFEEDKDAFAQLGLTPQSLAAVRSQGSWNVPTPIQELAIPSLLVDQENGNTINNNIVWCQAPTGSGKTAAYLLPLLQNLQRPVDKQQRMASLILCPTRELVTQVSSVLYQLTHNLKRLHKPKNAAFWKTITLTGGVPIEPQIAALADAARQGQTVDVVVATPGRLVDVLNYYYKDGGDTSAQDAALERRILNALGQDGHYASLGLEEIQKLKLDRTDDEGRGELVNLLQHLDYLILDEADRLLSRAFEDDIHQVLDLLPTQNQNRLKTWLFSATFPKQIEPQVDQVLQRMYGSSNAKVTRISCSHMDWKQQQEEEVSTTLQKKLNRTSLMAKTELESRSTASTIALRTIRLTKPARTMALRQLLDDHQNDWDRVVVFVATRYAAEHVSRKLRRAGYSAAELHGKLDHAARQRRLQDLTKGKLRVLLTTDLASRGLDIPNLPAMVNYDLPRSPADFVHRVGRVGRAGRSGTAVTFCTPDSQAHLDLIESKYLQEPVEREVLEGFEPDEEEWAIQVQASKSSSSGAMHSEKGLAHDKMYGGVKGRRKSKKDRLREAAVRSNSSAEKGIAAASK